MTQKKLVVSVHDVTPKYQGELTEIVSELSRRGIDKRNLLVVPNWEGQNDLRDHDSFVAWVHELQGSGDEVLQHGYTHRAAKRKGHYKSPVEWFMGEIFSKGTAEIQNLSYDEARQRIEIGQEILTEVGLNDISGFVSPAWLVNPEAERAMKDQGFSYHIYTSFWDLCNGYRVPVKDLQTGEESRTSEAFFDSKADPITQILTRLFAKMAVRKSSEVARIAIHPEDIYKSKPFDFALDLIEHVREGRELCTYRELFVSV